MKMPLIVLVSLWTAACAAQEAPKQASSLPPELANLASLVAQWRSTAGFRAETHWKQSIRSSVLTGGAGLKAKADAGPAPAADVELAANAVFIAAGREYRLTQEYKTDLMRNLSFDAAYDGKRFELLFRSMSQLRYGKDQDRKFLALFLPVVQIEPLQFLSATKVGKNMAYVAWPDLFADEKLVSARLHSGVIGAIGSGDRKRPVVTFGGGLYEGQPISYRLIIDGPAGQPSEVDYVDGAGELRYQMSFSYSRAKGGKDRWVPTRMESKAFDRAGEVIVSSVAETTSIDLNPNFAEDAFTIDLLSANTVYDMDARKTLSGREVVAPAENPATTPPHAVDSRPPVGLGKGE
jgi:hypothetical protein